MIQPLRAIRGYCLSEFLYGKTKVMCPLSLKVRHIRLGSQVLNMGKAIIMTVAKAIMTKNG
jgi:hypothetical protein